MEEGTNLQPQTPSNSSKTKRTKPVVNNRMVVGIIILLIVVIGGWRLYATGYNSGVKDGETKYRERLDQQANDRLVALPASGEVTKVSKDTIELKLLGTETRKAIINKDTQVSGKSGKLNVSDIKEGKRVILFTKKDGKDLVATRIVVQ